MRQTGEERYTIRNITIVSKKDAILDSFALVFLALYPLRHIHIGVDLQDTGYNYANYEYMGLGSMDPMWLFSTYLGNAIGHLMTLLPGGHTLLGMNFYTGLTVSLLAVLAYLFAVRRLKIPKGIALAGEFLAVSLCWCPTAKLYDYLTYVGLFLFGVLLYEGLARGSFLLLVLSGASLGMNVFVRFSNLPQALFIGVIWLYGIFEFREESRGEEGNVRGRERLFAWKQTMVRTGAFLAGYLGAAAVLLLGLGIRYGFSAYFAGISELLSASGSASGYSAREMLYLMARTYLQNLYWLSRILVFVAFGTLLCAAGKLLDKRRRERRGVVQRGGKHGLGLFRNGFSWLGLAYLANCAVAGGMVVWLAFVAQNFTSTYYRSYDPMVHGAILVLWLVLLTAAIRVFSTDASKEERLLSLLIAGTVLVSSVGSNNGLYPSFNNLFLAFPYLLWEVYRLLRVPEPEEGEERTAGTPEEGSGMRGGLRQAGAERGVEWLRVRFARLRPWLSPFALKICLAAFLALCAVQFAIFGAVFVFAEATGVADPGYMVSGNPALADIRMDRGKSELLTEVTGYVNQNGLEGKEVLLFAGLPGLSFYLQMPSAFNPWPDLETYDVGRFAAALEALRTAQEDALPVVILSETYASRAEGGEGVARNAQEEEKWLLLAEFLSDMDYRRTYRGKRFAIYEYGE